MDIIYNVIALRSDNNRLVIGTDAHFISYRDCKLLYFIVFLITMKFQHWSELQNAISQVEKEKCFFFPQYENINKFLLCKLRRFVTLCQNIKKMFVIIFLSIL